LALPSHGTSKASKIYKNRPDACASVPAGRTPHDVITRYRCSSRPLDTVLCASTLTDYMAIHTLAWCSPVPCANTASASCRRGVVARQARATNSARMRSYTLRCSPVHKHPAHASSASCPAGSMARRTSPCANVLRHRGLCRTALTLARGTRSPSGDDQLADAVASASPIPQNVTPEEFNRFMTLVNSASPEEVEQKAQALVNPESARPCILTRTLNPEP